jgi:hypothetical protein
MDEGLVEPTIAVDQLIVLARKRGIQIRPKSLNWPRLRTTTSAGPVLLRLNNGNMILALKNPQSLTEHLVVSDPLYRAGRSFLLPKDALEQVWSGDALPVEPQPTNTQRALRWVIGLLSLCGFVAAGFFLFQALREVIGH